MPIVLHNTPFQAWEASNWTVDSLASKSKDIQHILSKKGASNVFKYFAVDQPLSSVEMLSSEKDYVEVIYTSRTFFNLLRGPFDGSFYYASGGIELLNLGQSGSKESHLSMTFPSHLEAYSEPGQVNFWLGRANVTAYTHYDTSYNLHFVASGKKKFLLFPPDSYLELGLYPCLHQLYRQVGVDVLAEENLMEFVRKKRGFVVELVDGDTLYIPPYWFHTVITMETTFSLNIWSQSDTFLQMEDIYKSALPFEQEWGRAKIMKVVSHFVQLLLERALEDSSISSSDFMLSHVFSRYKVALKRKSLEFKAKLPKLRRSVQEYCLAGSSIYDLVGKDAASHVESGVSNIAELFLEIQPLTVRELNMANYLEHLLWRVLGEQDIMQLPFYLCICFNHHACHQE